MVYKPTQRRVAVLLKHPRTGRLDPIADVPTPRNGPPTLLCHSERSHRGLGPRRSEESLRPSKNVPRGTMWEMLRTVGECFAPLNPDRSQVRTPLFPKPEGWASRPIILFNNIDIWTNLQLEFGTESNDNRSRRP